MIRAPGGNFAPGGAVTRADMAEMLVAAFAHLSAPDRAKGLFTDTAGLTDGAVRAVEGIAAAEVTTGCAAAPRRYCPDENSRTGTNGLLLGPEPFNRRHKRPRP